MSNHSGKRLGILVGGGPAPGINSAISSVTIEARNSGLTVVGIYDGFEHLVEGHIEVSRELGIEDVSRIHYQGGSYLRTSRTNPQKSPETLHKVVDSLRRLDLSYLVSIGGEDTASGAAAVARAAEGAIRVAHVPKTIDNDLPLPAGMPTFGYETARNVGTQLVLTIMEDSRTTNRWFVVVVMGRKAGHLALGIGKAAGATLTVIPEEFPQARISLDDVSRVIEGAIIKRRLTSQAYGVAIVAEGVAEKIDPEEFRRMAGIEVSRDPYGHVSLADIPLAALLKQRVQKRFADRGDAARVTDVTLGYELRCAQPIPFDIDYTRTLGYGAVRFLMDEPESDEMRVGGVVCLDGVNLNMLPFDALKDPDTGATKVRVVDLGSVHYKVARDYMIRLEEDDLQDGAMIERLAAAAKMTPEAFQQEFAGAGVPA
ncbi:MAG TPA: diphosphate--fructose-6-phosphate 1-phosphotransferase [Dehalococcoidia bacterium]|nr:diphosphate--fructose-6-phosphate 1-phosphotransferase [Dehalococcoidia bacterium]